MIPREEARGAGDVAVVIVNYRTPDLAIECCRSVAEQRGAARVTRAIVVDGGSGDGSAARIAAALAAPAFLGWASALPLPINGGFGYANNQALLTLAAEGPLPEFLCLLNPDARLRPGALAALANCLATHPRAGAVGARLEQEDGTPQGSAFTFPDLRGEFLRGVRTDLLRRLLRVPPMTVTAPAACRVPWVTGAAVMFRREALAETGLFDDGFFLYFEETELMHRLARAGWDIWHEPVARVVHHGGVATNLRDPATGLALRKRQPRYWYDARRRYFMRTGGAPMLLAAGAAWLAGRMIGLLRVLAGHRPGDAVPHELRDMMAFSLWPRREDVRRAPLPTFATLPGAPPLWMDH